ncbi:hypothetical protein FQR65_LT02464 [Abscondita terminalis]|nr:hypothetical protein FQR65_LT02464 [Abscondita terminalis]
MSKDIRSFFSVLSTKKATGGDSIKPKKRPVIVESSDEDVIPETPKSKKTEKAVKKRKISDSDDDGKRNSKKSNKRDTKTTNSINLKPVDISSVFSDAPIKQTPVPEMKQKIIISPEQIKKPRSKKGEKNRKKGVETELGIHNDANFEKSLLDLDEDFLIDNVDELDRTINDSMKAEVKEEENKNLGKTPKKPVEGKLQKKGPAHHGSKELPKGKPDCLKDLCFLRTGVLDSLENSEFETLIKDHGGRVVHGISKKVNFVVVGEDAGPAKLEKAKNYGIKLISEDELLDLIRLKSGMATGTEKKVEPDLDKNVEKKSETPKPSTTSTSQKLEIKVDKKVVKTEPIKKPAKVEPQVHTKQSIKENNLSWTDKYKPKSVKNIIGQQTDKSNMRKLLHWLENWFKNHGSKNKPKLTKPSPWAKSDDGAYFKAALLSGPPGVGKTTTATLVAKELGFDVVEFNASDTRSKKLLHEEVSQLLSTKSLAGYFNGGDAPSSKHVLLMDEVDGMAGNEDRGGVQELIALIKNSNIPVICMCNDRNHPKIRSLSNYCFDLRFARPKLEQIKGAMMSVCFKEGVKINSETLTEIINSAGMDIRQILTHLSLWTADENGNEDIKGPKKDSPIGPWEVCRKVFSSEEHKSSSISDRERLFFFDYSIAPLFVQENYLNVMPHAPKKDHLKLFAAAANSISMGDVVDSKIRQSNNWSLLSVEAMCYSVLPGTLLSGHVNARIDFPGWLGKNSKRNKFTRLLGELQAHMRTSISANRSEVNLDYISPIRRGITEPLAKKGSDGIDDAIEVMHAYNLLREDLDSILELAQWPRQNDPMNMVESKVKAAFTRSYNKASAMLPYAINSNISKKKGTTINEGEYGISEEEEEDDNSESDEKDITKDAMIKAKKATSKAAKKDEPSTSTNKRGTKGGTARAPKKIKK